MARVVLGAVIINNTQTLFDGDGDVRRWSTTLTRELKSAVKAKAPPRRSRARWIGRRSSGAMNRSIRGVTSRSGRLQTSTTVGVNTYYAQWVLGGTAAQGRRYIYSNNGWRFKIVVDQIARRVARGGKVDADFVEMQLYMRLPLSNVGGSRVFHLRVHGQRANNFLIDGYNEVARFHRSLKPMANRFAF